MRDRWISNFILSLPHTGGRYLPSATKSAVLQDKNRSSWGQNVHVWYSNMKGFCPQRQMWNIKHVWYQKCVLTIEISCLWLLHAGKCCRQSAAIFVLYDCGLCCWRQKSPVCDWLWEAIRLLWILHDFFKELSTRPSFKSSLFLGFFWPQF